MGQDLSWMGFKPGPVGYRHIQYYFVNLLNICFYRKMKKKIPKSYVLNTIGRVGVDLQVFIIQVCFNLILLMLFTICLVKFLILN